MKHELDSLTCPMCGDVITNNEKYCFDEQLFKHLADNHYMWKYSMKFNHLLDGLLSQYSGREDIRHRMWAYNMAYKLKEVNPLDFYEFASLPKRVKQFKRYITDYCKFYNAKDPFKHIEPREAIKLLISKANI